jgi:hypothetical protein
MTMDNRLSSAGDQSPYRLVVKARTQTGRKKGYCWEIVRDNVTNHVVRQSPEAYGTMEEAHACGVAILNQTPSKRSTRP